MAALKARVRGLLQAGDLEGIAALAASEHRVLGALVPLTYLPDKEMAWRAVEATGMAAERVAASDAAAVLEHLRKLFWLMTEESGAICWRAPEAMAEIVARCPDRYPEFIPIVAHLVEEMAEEDLAHFGPAVLWALGRLGPLAAGEMPSLTASVVRWLGHPHPQRRGLAVWALARTNALAPLYARPELLQDGGRVRLRTGGAFRETTVAELVGEALGGPVGVAGDAGRDRL